MPTVFYLNIKPSAPSRALLHDARLSPAHGDARSFIARGELRASFVERACIARGDAARIARLENSGEEEIIIGSNDAGDEARRERGMLEVPVQRARVRALRRGLHPEVRESVTESAGEVRRRGGEDEEPEERVEAARAAAEIIHRGRRREHA